MTKTSKVARFIWLGAIAIIILLFARIAHAQSELFVPSCGTSYACTLQTSVAWDSNIHVWIFRPIQPNVSLRIFIRNNNTTSAHAPTVTAWITGSRTAVSFLVQKDRWEQAAITDNTTTNEKCAAQGANSSNAAATSTGNGSGTCYSAGMYAAQIAIVLVGDGAKSGSPDTFDVDVVQSPSTYPGGPKPGNDSSAGGQVITGTTPADTISNTTVPGSQSYNMVFNGTTWDRMRGDATRGIAIASNTGVSGVDAMANNVVGSYAAPGGTTTVPQVALSAFNGATWDRLRAGINADASSPTGFGSFTPYVFNGATWDRWRGIQSAGPAAQSDANTNANGYLISNTTGGSGGQLGVFPFLFNGTTWDRARGSINSDAQTPTGFSSFTPYVFNGTTWDRIRGGASGYTTQSTTGVLLNRPKEIATFSVETAINAPAATPTDIMEICGNGTTTVQITRWEVGFTATAAPASNLALLWLRRSTVDTGGGPASFTVVQYDSSDPANSTTPRSFTSNPATGALVGAIKGVNITPDNILSNSDPQNIYSYVQSPGAKPWTLRGATQCIYLNLNGATLPANFQYTSTLEWIERNDI